MIVVGTNDNVFKEELYVSPVVNVIKFEFEGIQCGSPQLENGGVLDEEEGEW
jgi:hypothetical protein